MTNATTENPAIPNPKLRDEPPHDPDVYDLQNEAKLETILQVHQAEITQALELNDSLYANEQIAHDANGFELYWEYIVQQLGAAASYLNENQEFFEYMRGKARENYDTILSKHEEGCEKTYEEAKERVETEMVLDEEELQDEELMHGGVEKLRAYLLRKIRDLQKTLKPKMYERLLREVIEPLLEKRVAEYMNKHKEGCEKTYEEAKERVETEMVLDEEELQDEELMHGGVEKLRAYLLRKIRDLKKTLAPETYERLYSDVIEPLLEKRVAEYMNKHEEGCEKTYEEAKERVETEMVLDEEERQDEELMDGGAEKLREHLLRKIRDLQKTLKPKMYERLLREVIEPLLEERIAEYIAIYDQRKRQNEEDDEGGDGQEDGEDGNENGKDNDLEGDQDTPEATEGPQENLQETPSETTNEAPQAAESTNSISADSMPASSESSGGGDAAQGGEGTTSQESATQTNETSASLQSQSTVSDGSPTAEASAAGSSVDSTKKATAEVTKELKQSESSEQRKVKAPSQKKPETRETFTLGALAGIKHLLSKGEAYFKPFLLKWENSLDSAQYRKVAHEISSGAKTAETFVQWLFTDQRVARLMKQYPGEWQQFSFGLKLFGFTENKEEEDDEQQESRQILEKRAPEEGQEIQDESPNETQKEETIAEIDSEDEKDEVIAGIDAEDEELAEEITKEIEEEPALAAIVEDIEESQEPENSEPEEPEIEPKIAPIKEQPENNEPRKPVENIEASLASEKPMETIKEVLAVKPEGQISTNEKIAKNTIEPLKLKNVDENEENKAASPHREFLSEPFEAQIREGKEQEASEQQVLGQEASEQQAPETEDVNIEGMLTELEQTEDMVEQVQELEESLWEMVDDVMLTIEDSELRNEYAEELESLDTLFQHLVEHGMELPQGTEVLHEDQKNQEDCNAQNLSRLMLLLTSFIQEQEENRNHVWQKPRSTQELFQILIKQLSGTNSYQLERKILAILRYYPQFRFLLMLMLSKQYLEAQDVRYIRLMALIYQEQYGAKVMGLQEMIEMLMRFIRFIGKRVESEQDVHESLHDYNILNAKEVFSHFAEEIDGSNNDLHQLQFVSRRHHSRFDQGSNRARALLHMNMGGLHACRKVIGHCRLIASSEKNLEAA